MAYIKAIILFLPELVNLIKMISSALASGVEDYVIRKKLQSVEKAFDPTLAPADAARALNDVFRGSK